MTWPSGSIFSSPRPDVFVECVIFPIPVLKCFHFLACMKLSNILYPRLLPIAMVFYRVPWNGSLDFRFSRLWDFAWNNMFSADAMLSSSFEQAFSLIPTEVKLLPGSGSSDRNRNLVVACTISLEKQGCSNSEVYFRRTILISRCFLSIAWKRKVAFVKVGCPNVTNKILVPDDRSWLASWYFGWGGGVEIFWSEFMIHSTDQISIYHKIPKLQCRTVHDVRLVNLSKSEQIG